MPDFLDTVMDVFLPAFAVVVIVAIFILAIVVAASSDPEFDPNAKCANHHGIRIVNTAEGAYHNIVGVTCNDGVFIKNNL